MIEGTTTLLCDADGTLFPSEEPAYAASALVTNRLLGSLGADRTYEPAQLQAMTNGKNFRAAAGELAGLHGRALEHSTLDDWVHQEKVEVTEHLRQVLRPDPAVAEPLAALAREHVLAAVTSSALSRLDACLTVTGLADLVPPDRRFSAEDSLPRPTSKPDPAVYAHAGRRLGVSVREALAIEDSVNGARSAVDAGFPTIGLLQFVPVDERSRRAEQLSAVGVREVVADWDELRRLIAPGA